jgi:UDP-N-acetylmuramate dehydrogenase
LFQGAEGDRDEIRAHMDEITAAREASQPIKSRTGGSTFKNPPGNKSWQLIDAAGMRGFNIGPAKVSEMHCNFLINEGGATAAQIEELGETVRERVKETSGVELDWEIRRIGVTVAILRGARRMELRDPEIDPRFRAYGRLVR